MFLHLEKVCCQFGRERDIADVPLLRFPGIFRAFVNMNEALLEVDIAPAKSLYFSETQSSEVQN
jgi:hypothetical protein